MTKLKMIRPVTLAAAAALGLGALAAGPAAAQWGNRDHGGGPILERFDDSRNRQTVSIRTVPVGEFCVRAVEAVGYDPRLNRRLYRVRFDSGPITSLGVVAFENAFSGARTEGDAVRALAAGQHDAAPYRRGRGEC
ncbi:hypothetical protein [Phreatobacter sp.]|uniref:hypothetical protein n=1 Tax=Phreatobacter sp. TaxID=1966341 RepID=UPI003F72E5D1